MKILFAGFGYSAAYAAKLLHNHDLYGTTRSGNNFSYISENGAKPLLFDGSAKIDLSPYDCIITSISPHEGRDVFYEMHHQQMRDKLLIYLSTTGVYGNHNGAWVDEDTPTEATSERAAARIYCEKQWLNLSDKCFVLRLAGIYGDGRNALQQLRDGTARRIYKENQYFSRIHVHDIARSIFSSIENPKKAGIYNICDDLPAPAHEVVEYAANLLGIEPPPLLDYRTANLGAMARGFYANSRKVSNKKMRNILNVELEFSTYIEGLTSLQKIL